MIIPSLGISRFFDMKCQHIKLPQSSVMAVGIDREKMASLIQGKNIRLQTIINRIGLSKSRYYRWINYDVDLPLEYILGIKNILGMSDYEFSKYLIPSTEDILIILSSCVYYSSYTKKDILVENIVSRTDKYEDEMVYYDFPMFYVGMYEKAVNAVKNNEPSDNYINKIDKYLENIDSFTTFDIFLKMAVVQLKSSIDYSTKAIDISIFLEIILNNIFSEDFITGNVFFGFAIDFVIFFSINFSIEQGLDLINIILVKDREIKWLDQYSLFLIDEIRRLFESDDYQYKDIAKNIKKSHPTYNSDEYYFQYLSEYFDV